MNLSPSAMDDDSQFRIQLLGKFVVWAGGERIPDEKWHLRRARSLIKLLALTPTHRLHRDQVADTLWPDSDLAASANNFHQTLYAARKVLGPSGASCLRLEEGFLRLSGEKGQPPWVDVEQFDLTAAAAKESHDPARYQAALDLYQGDLLPEDLYEEWIVPRREAFRQQYLGLLLELAQLLEASQEYPRAIEAVERLLAAERGNEEGYIQLMRLYALSGKRGQALRQYQTLRDALREELDAEPGAAAARLYEEIQANRFPPAEVSAPPASSPPSAAGPRHNLPAHLTSFIGREQEISAVCQWVLKHRLVTLTGAGGVGKTRLALRAAEQLLEQFAQGAWLVELAPLSDPALVARAVAESLGVREQPGQELIKTLAGFLQPRSLLLILDNCEHVIGEAAALASQLLQGCSNLHILATSREILSVEGETPFRCPSLSLPEEQRLPDLAELAQSEAVRLFVMRSCSIQPDFTLTETNAEPVSRICRRLDGIPLAIELAAARTRMLSVEQIAARLDQAFRLLTGGSRSVLPRHQTLKALIDWSYNLLSPEERVLLLRLSVFAGGWTLEAAEQVCADPKGETGPVEVQEEQVVELLGQLIDKSLILFDPSRAGEPRYRMLETIRQYAHDRLVESGGGETVRERHLDYFLSLSLRAEPHLRSRGAKEWLGRLDREIDNLRLALEWAYSGSIEKGLQLAAALFQFWHIRNHDMEGAEWLERLLRAQEKDCDPHALDLAGKIARGRALNVFSNLIVTTGNVLTVPQRLVGQKKAVDQEGQAIFLVLGEAYLRDYAISRFNQLASRWKKGESVVEDSLECRSLFRRVNDLFWESECDQILSRSFSPDDERTALYREEYLSLKKEIGDWDGEGFALYLLGDLEFCRGNTDRSFELMFESLDCFEIVENQEYVAMIRDALANLYIVRGDYQEAIRQSELAHAIALELSNQDILYAYLYRQAYIAWARREYELVVHYCEEALKLGGELSYVSKIRLYYFLCRAALSQGKVTQARDYLKNMLETIPVVDWDLIHLSGILAAAVGQMPQSATLFGAQDTHGGWLKNTFSLRARTEYEQALAVARDALGEEAFKTAWESGREMTDEQVRQYVLDFINEKLPAN